MGATIRVLIISTAIVIPWGILRVTDLEPIITSALMPLISNDYVIIGLLVIPPMALWLIRWLFEPRRKKGKRSFGNKSIILRFRG